VPEKDPMHNPTRKLPTRTRKETRDLELSLQPESPRKLTSRSIATSARIMEAHIPHTTQRIVVGTRKMEQKKLISVPPREANRSTIPQGSLLCNGARN
jgi:hypothetical protein